MLAAVPGELKAFGERVYRKCQSRFGQINLLKAASQMISQLIAFCTSNNGLLWLLLGSNLSIAAAYFAIPLTMAVVIRHRRRDIPYPWLWTLFVTFIVACGLTHLAHVWSALSGAEYLELQAAINVLTALASVGTAIAFGYVLPQIKMLPSPKRQHDQLQKLVDERSKEKDQLVREINHRIGNQLQVLSSMVSVESRNAASQESLNILDRLRSELVGMAEQHVKLSRHDFLELGIGAAEGSIAPAPGAAANS